MFSSNICHFFLLLNFVCIISDDDDDDDDVFVDIGVAAAKNRKFHETKERKRPQNVCKRRARYALGSNVP